MPFSMWPKTVGDAGAPRSALRRAQFLPSLATIAEEEEEEDGGDVIVGGSLLCGKGSSDLAARNNQALSSKWPKSVGDAGSSRSALRKARSLPSLATSAEEDSDRSSGSGIER